MTTSSPRQGGRHRRVSVNGIPVAGIDQSNISAIGLSGRLRPGTNAITVTVSTTVYNAVRTTGDPIYHNADEQTGLIGPVTLTPYGTSSVNSPGASLQHS